MKQTTMAEFIESTNFDALRTQKTALIAAQAALNAIGGKEQTDIAWELEGLINFLDAYQDIAVDQYGKDASEVFNLTDEEPKEDFYAKQAAENKQIEEDEAEDEREYSGDASDAQWENWK
jgi:hypothetical protein